MIYQCYLKKEQKEHLFQSSEYTPFGLTPETNPTLLLNCPELEDPDNRLAFNEYACFLWFYRNQEKIPDMFGTTSYRQLDKSPYIHSDGNKLGDHKILTWGLSRLLTINGWPLPVSLQQEAAHPGLTSYLKESLNEVHNIDIPMGWFTQNEVIFGNYWLMQKSSFLEFMDFSWPLVSKALKDFKNKSHRFFTNDMRFGCDKRRSVGFFAEKIFILWYFLADAKVVSYIPAKGLKSPIEFYE